MTKDEAAEELGISVRSLQRLVQSGKIGVTYKRGDSGKQEAILDAAEVETFKQNRDAESVKPATATTNDTALARNNAQQFLEILKSAVTPPTKPAGVPIADKPLLKLDEAAALTGLSRDILRKAIETGDLQAKLIGRAWRVKRENLNEYIQRL